MQIPRPTAIRPAITSLIVSCAATCLFAQSGADAFLPSPVRSISTVAANGDVNPHGVAFINDNFQASTGLLQQGDILVSNFNNFNNTQGTGTTIIRIPTSGVPSTFFQGTAPLGLSTGLGAGFILVTNVPTNNVPLSLAGNRVPFLSSIIKASLFSPSVERASTVPGMLPTLTTAIAQSLSLPTLSTAPSAG